jgi:hypothetical protein
MTEPGSQAAGQSAGQAGRQPPDLLDEARSLIGDAYRFFPIDSHWRARAVEWIDEYRTFRYDREPHLPDQDGR